MFNHMYGIKLCLIHMKTVSFVTPNDLNNHMCQMYLPNSLNPQQTHTRVCAFSISLSLSPSLSLCVYLTLPFHFSLSFALYLSPPLCLSLSPSFHSKSNFCCNELLRITHLTGVACYHKHCSLGRYLFNSLLYKPSIQLTSTN